VGISGATCSGKTTLSYLLGKLFYNSRVYKQDDFYYAEDDPRHIRSELEEFTDLPEFFTVEWMFHVTSGQS
jgi:uridine kinase